MNKLSVQFYIYYNYVKWSNNYKPYNLQNVKQSIYMTYDR